MALITNNGRDSEVQEIRRLLMLAMDSLRMAEILNAQMEDDDIAECETVKDAGYPMSDEPYTRDESIRNICQALTPVLGKWSIIE